MTPDELARFWQGVLIAQQQEVAKATAALIEWETKS